MNYLIGIILIGYGLFSIFNPDSTIRMRHLLVYKEGAEPTDFAIIAIVIMGILSVILGFLFFFPSIVVSLLTSN